MDNISNQLVKFKTDYRIVDREVSSIKKYKELEEKW